MPDALGQTESALQSLLEAFEIPHLRPVLSDAGCTTLQTFSGLSAQQISRIHGLSDRDRFSAHSAIAAAQKYVASEPPRLAPTKKKATLPGLPPYGTTVAQQRRIRGEQVPFLSPPFPSEESGVAWSTNEARKSTVSSEWRRFGPSGPLEPYLDRPQSGKRNQRHFTISHCPTLGSTNCERWNQEIKRRQERENRPATGMTDRIKRETILNAAEQFADYVQEGENVRQAAHRVAGTPSWQHQRKIGTPTRRGAPCTPGRLGRSPKPSAWWSFANCNSPTLLQRPYNQMLCPIY